MGKRNLVLWSGGLDTTHVVYDNLSKGNKVAALYIELTNNEDKVKLEKTALKKITKILQKLFPDKLEVYYSYTISLLTGNYADVFLHQAYVWASIAPLFTHNVDETQIAYAMNDDAVSYISEVRKIYNACFGLIATESGKPVPLKFPLLQRKKINFIDEIPDDILQHVTSCENPVKGKQCGTSLLKHDDKCHACKRFFDTFGVATAKEYIEGRPKEQDLTDDTIKEKEDMDKKKE